MSVIDAYFHALTHAARHAAPSFRFQVVAIPGDVDVLQIAVQGRDIPIYLSISGNQLLCLAHLFADAQVIPEKRADMHQRMLQWNIPLPHSAFAQAGNLYVLFANLFPDAPTETVVSILHTLSDNAEEVTAELAPFLRAHLA